MFEYKFFAKKDEANAYAEEKGGVVYSNKSNSSTKEDYTYCAVDSGFPHEELKGKDYVVAIEVYDDSDPETAPAAPASDSDADTAYSDSVEVADTVSVEPTSDETDAFSSMNPPAIPAGTATEEAGDGSSSSPVTLTPEQLASVSPVTKNTLSKLNSHFRDLTKNFIKIGYELLQVRDRKMFKELGYSSFEGFVKAELKLSKASAYNFMNCCIEYSVKDEYGLPTDVIAKEYRLYKSTQLIAMLGLDKDALIAVSPETPVKDIKDLAKASADAASGFSDPDSDEDSADAEGKEDKPKKKNTKDVTIPAQRLSMAVGATWDTVVNDNTKSAVEKFLEAHQGDGRCYRVEICLVYTDDSDI